MNNQIDLAFTQVVNRIEPVTRFNRTSFKPASNNVRKVQGKAHWQFTASISNDREENPKRLPYNATRIDSEEKLNQVAQQTAQAGRDALTTRISAWLNTNEKNDRQLQPSDCFPSPMTFGFEYKHATCSGEGRVRCGGCDHGYNDCGTCNASGRVACSNCNHWPWGSTGKERCRGCRGSKQVNGMRCGTCNGRGEVTCTVCHGAKSLVCKKCKGERRLVHSTCNGTGWVTCKPCEGSGYFHILRKVTCAVSDRFTVELKDPKSEVVQQLVKRDLVSLRSLASITQEKPQVRENVALREYQFECLITELGLLVNDQKLELVGFGNKAQIFDFKRIASLLLAQDLTQLDQAVAKTSWKLWGTPIDLIKTTRVFLDSEVNLQIDDPKLVTDSVVDRAYVTRVQELLPQALGILMVANLGLAYLGTLLLPVVVFFIWYLAGLQEEIGLLIFVTPAIVGITSWVLLEVRMRNQLRVMLNDKTANKVDPMLHKYHLLWIARGIAVGLLGIILTIMAILPLP